MKIMVIGDIHTNFEYLNQFLESQKPDIILQCGDFGWWPHYHGTEKIWQNKRFDQYSVKPGKTRIYWCDGNHENHDDLQERVAAAPDGPIEIPVPGCFYMRRGSILTLDDGRNVLFFGGAMSTDRETRIEGDEWWADEVPTQKDLDYARKQIALHGGRVDIVISHTAPFLVAMQLQRIDPLRRKDTTSFLLNQILEEYNPTQWFFGHFHMHDMGWIGDCQWTALDMALGGSKWCAKIESK